MALDAGSVFATLGGRFNPAGFMAFDSTMKKSGAAAASAEKTMTGSFRRSGEAAAAMASQVASSAAKVESLLLKQRQATLAVEKAQVTATAANSKFGTSSLEARDATLALTAAQQKQAAITRDLSAAQGAHTLAQGKAAQASSRTAGALTALGSAAKTGAVVGIAAVGVGLFKAVQSATKFDESMRNVNSIAQLSEGQFKNLSRSVLTLAGKTAQAPVTLADGLYTLVSSGFSAKDSLTILASSAKAASAGLTDTGTSTSAVAAVLNAYKRPAKDAAQVSDDLFQTVNVGVLSFEQLASSIGDVLPFGQAMGVDLKQLGGAIATVTKAGIDAPNAMTRIKGALSALLKPSNEMQVAFKQLGVTSGTELVQKTGSLQAALQAVTGTVGNNKTAVAKLFPDIRALSAALLLTGTNAAGANKDLSKFANDSGATDKALSQQKQSLAFKIKEMKANVDALAISVGGVLIPVLSKAAAGLNGFLSALQGSSSGAQILRALAVAVGAMGAAAVIGPRLLPLANGISAIGMAARTAPSISAFASDLVAMANPVGIAAVAVGVLAAGIYVLATSESSETRIAREMADAKRAQVSAIEALNAANHDVVASGLDYKQALLAQKDAQAKLNQATKDGKKGTQEWNWLQNQAQQANLAVATTKAAATKATEDDTAAQKKNIQTARDAIAQAQANIAAAQPRPMPRGGHMAGDPNAEAAGKRQLAAAETLYAQALAKSNSAGLDQRRLQQGVQQILPQYAVGIKVVSDALRGVPNAKQVKFLVNGDQAVVSKIGDVITSLAGVATRKQITTVLTGAASAEAGLSALTAVAMGVPVRRVVAIEARHLTAKGQIAALVAAVAAVPAKHATNFSTNVHAQQQQLTDYQNQIDNLHGKTVTITTVQKTTHASGSVAGSDHNALVGEGGGPEWIVNRATRQARKVSGPQLTHLSADEYVIPTEQKYRPQALGLLGMLAADLGIGAYAAGAPASKKKTPHRTAKQRDADELKFYGSHDLSYWDTAIAAQQNKVYTKGKDKGKVTDAAKKEIARLRGERNDANDYQKKIDFADREANLDSDLLTAAVNNNDGAAYSSASVKRRSNLNTLITLLTSASGKSGKGAWNQTIRAQLASARSALSAMPSTNDIPSTGAYSQAELDELKHEDYLIALAATTDDGGVDDRAALKKKADYLESIWNNAFQLGGAGRGGEDGLTTIANDLKSARDAVTSSSSSSSPTTSADAVQTELNNLAAAGRTAFGSYGNNFNLAGGGGGGSASAASGASVKITNNYQAPPEDPHSWSAGLAYELKAAL